MEFNNIEEKVIYEKLTKAGETGKTEFAAAPITSIPVQNPGTVGAVIDPAITNPYFSELSERIGMMEANRVNLLEIPIEPVSILHPIKKAKYFVKRIVRKCATWAAYTASSKQTMFNNSVVPAIGRLTELQNMSINAQNGERAHIDAMSNVVQAMEAKVTAMQSRLDEVAATISSLGELRTMLESYKKNSVTADQFETLKERLVVVEKSLDSHRKDSVTADRFETLKERLVVVEKMLAFLEKQCVDQERFNRLENRVMSDALTYAKTEWLSTLQFRVDHLEQTSAQNDGLMALVHRMDQGERGLEKLSENLATSEHVEDLSKKVDMFEKWFTSSTNMMQTVNDQFQIMEEQGIIRRVDAIREEDEQVNLVKRSLAQSGEDSILAYVMRVLGIDFERCTYLDLGANHAKLLSNTYYFYNKGARGVLVEANPALIPELKLYRNEDIVLNCCISEKEGDVIDFYVLNGDGLSTPDKERVEEVLKANKALKVDRVVPVRTMTVNQIIESYFDKAPVYMNIDLEGDDKVILASIDWEAHRPLLVTIEMIPYRPRLVVGEKDSAILRFMESVDYIEYAFTGVNSIFIDKRQIKDVLA